MVTRGKCKLLTAQECMTELMLHCAAELANIQIPIQVCHSFQTRDFLPCLGLQIRPCLTCKQTLPQHIYKMPILTVLISQISLSLKGHDTKATRSFKPGPMFRITRTRTASKSLKDVAHSHHAASCNTFDILKSLKDKLWVLLCKNVQPVAVSTLHSHCLSNGFWRTFVGPCHFRWTQRTVRRKSVGIRWTWLDSAASPAKVQWKSTQTT